MTEITSEAGVTARTPWHIWVVGILALLWNASGAYTIMSAQAGRLPGLDADEAAYYAAQPNWPGPLSSAAWVECNGSTSSPFPSTSDLL